MSSDFESLNILLRKKKKLVPTNCSEAAVKNILLMLEELPKELRLIAARFDERSSLEPIIEGKRSLRDTLLHLLNIEGLNYTTIFPAFLLDKPTIYPLHAERDLRKLNLFSDFSFEGLLETFCLERRKTLNFLRSLEMQDWTKQMIKSGKAREETIYSRARELAMHDFVHVQTLKFQLNI
ncbi:MAG: hypothetical protein KDB79_15155 [Acidobacteria bacterium]|nr:hypothetical protein [Acidobacteriota bacterium]